MAAPTFTGLVRLPSTVTINTAAYTWPSAVAASSGYVLACSSAGVLSWVAPSGGGGGMAIGGVVGGGTAGRVLYEGAGAVLADSANLTFNGTKLATTGDLEVDGSIFQGATRLIHTYGTENLFVGLDAGNVTMSGSYNVAFGAGSLLNNTTGNQNVALGRIALASNTTGSLNMAMGCNALYSNTAGAANVGIGNQALTTNATGSNNVALGNSALTDPPASSDNIAIGSRALPNGGIGDQNIGIGSNAGNFCRTSDNVLIGHTAFYSLTTGSDNVGIGWCSGRNITTGGFNVFVGANAGFGAATIGAVTGGATVGYNTQLGGNYSTAVGYGAVCTSQYSVALGANVTAAIDHQVVLGTAAETVVLPGGKIVHRTAVSNNYSITATDYLLGVTSTAAAYTLTLPTATGVAGQAYIIKDESGGAATNNITLTTTSCEYDRRGGEQEDHRRLRDAQGLLERHELVHLLGVRDGGSRGETREFHRSGGGPLAADQCDVQFVGRVARGMGRPGL